MTKRVIFKYKILVHMANYPIKLGLRSSFRH